MKQTSIFVVACVLLAGCGLWHAGPTLEPVGDVPLFSGLGEHTRPVDTGSADAQRYFDQGLNFLFAFNHDEAIRSFRKTSELDSSCAMAWWGIAIANGPHINNPMMPPDREKAAWEAAQEAQRRSGHASEVDRALIEALTQRYTNKAAFDGKALDAAYADAMRGVWQRFPQDDDVGALFAEALMDLRPWDFWTADGKPQPGTEELLTTLEKVISRNPSHPHALHLYIHAVEASPNPEKGDAAADRLRDLEPGLGHMVHMPSHIDVRRGRWEQAMLANSKAIESDRKYRELSPRQGFYTVYMSHNRHMLAYAAMMTGHRAEAVKAIDEMLAQMPPEFVDEMAAVVDGFMAMPLEVRMRFGMWDDILAAPEFPERFPLARALRHYARGVAYAARGRTKEARAEQQAMIEAKAKVPTDAAFLNNSAADLIKVAEQLLDGEILYREGKMKAAIESLRNATGTEDTLRYDEPPDWIQPTRHALGAALLQSRRWKEAEAVFRDDLRRVPENGWSLYGLARSLRHQHKDKEASEVESRFAKVWAQSDTKISSPCFCQPGI
ncbi:MAG: hypothetical protein HY270_02585 [Deltaproteobacteria bacterium]|nr:hypothetical protein [Deltaproteobacteria bacterium]